jgi:hypothetical protein
MHNSWNGNHLGDLCLRCLRSSINGWLGSAVLALICSAMLVGVCTISQAQTVTGQFNGHVYDTSGNVVVGAKLTLLDMQTGLTRSVNSNGAGLYEFPLVAPGNYKITATATGFQSDVAALTLEVNQILTQDFKLQVGATSTTVSVSATTEQLQASTANLGAVVEEQTVGNLPLNGRSFSALLTLTPGENPVNFSQNGGTGFSVGFGSPGIPGSTYVFPSTQGQWNRENLYYLDGVINTGGAASSYDVPPIIDSIQEFKILSHDDQAEYGGVLGGVVNLVTKSGTDVYHGALWEYLRNNVFDSRNPFTDFNGNNPAPPAPFRQNEYGADFGGHLKIPQVDNERNKTFFFAAWEAWKYSNAAGVSYISPTAAELSGDFTNASIVTSTGAPPLLYNPFLTTGTAGNYSRPLLGNGLVIPSGMIDTAVQTFIAGYSDTPNFTPTVAGGNNTILNTVGTNDAESFTGRVDQNWGSNNTVWFRYSFLNGNAVSPGSKHASSLSSQDSRNLGGGVTHVFSPHLILDATLGYSGRFNSLGTTTFTGVPAGAGAIFSAVDTVYGFANFSYGGFGGGGGSYNGIGGSGPSLNQTTELNFAVNMTWMKGSHQFRFGAQEQIPQWIQGLNGEHFGGNSWSFETYETDDPNNQGSTGNSLASALLGVPDNGRFQSEYTGVRTIAPSFYFEDSWKANRRLTINAGLRLDGESSPHLLIGTSAAMLDPNTGNWIVSGGKLPPPCNPAGNVYAPCIPTVASDPALTPADAAVLAAHVVPAANPNLGPAPIYSNLGPRVGIAYQITPKTVIRGGYGLIYDNVTGSIQTVRDRLLAWPSNASLPLQFNVTGQPIDTIEDVIPTVSASKALPTVPTPWGQFGWYYDPHLKDHYSNQFNLDIQQQVTSSLMASVSYVGSFDRHLPLTGLDNNSPVPGENGADRPFPWAGSEIEATSVGTSNFNALEVRVDKRATAGLNFGTGFTWSKSMDNGASGYYDVESGTAGFSAVQNYNDLNADYGLSGQSLKFLWYGYGSYQLPFGPGQRWANKGGFESVIIGGWQANINASAHSGIPLSFPDAGSDPAEIGNDSFVNYCRASVTGSPKVGHPTSSADFNTSVFYHPVAAYGNTSRDLVTAMPYDNFDFSVFKQFHAWERLNFQFRGELFNVFNIQNYGLPGTTFGASSFGVITSLAQGATPRQIQLSLRADF